MNGRWYLLSGALGVLLLVVGHGMGLFAAPPEAMMQDIGRILYAHVPTAWVALVCFLVAFVAAIGSLWTGRRSWDAMVAASIEVGVVLSALLIFQGAMWGKATWGVYWSWDPRLTSTAIMIVAFAVILLMRQIIEQPERRMLVTAVATIIAFVDVPVVYFAADWWASIHQDHSSPETVSMSMVWPLRISAFGMLFLSLGFIGARRRLELRWLEAEDAPDALPERPAELNLSEKVTS